MDLLNLSNLNTIEYNQSKTLFEKKIENIFNNDQPFIKRECQKNENQYLKDENSRLENENNRLKNKVKYLEVINHSILKKNKNLKEEIAALKNQVKNPKTTSLNNALEKILSFDKNQEI